MTTPAYDFPQTPQPGQPGYSPTSGGAGAPSPTVTGGASSVTTVLPNGTTIVKQVEGGNPAYG